MRRSCAHPRAGASRRRARPAPVPDWPVVPSRASRWPPSSLSSPHRSGSPISSPRRTLHGAPPSLLHPPSTGFSTFPFFLFFLSLPSPIRYFLSGRSRRVVELVDRHARARARATPEIGGGKISRRTEKTRKARADFPERLKLRESGSLLVRENQTTTRSHVSFSRFLSLSFFSLSLALAPDLTLVSSVYTGIFLIASQLVSAPVLYAGIHRSLFIFSYLFRVATCRRKGQLAS